MIDFNRLMQSTAGVEATDPLEIFEGLPKSSQINSLYHVQAEILRTWYKRRDSNPDVVVELNTGGGKTLVGLLMALSTMRELREGVLYLVETKQLAEQVVAQAAMIGIPAKTYQGGSSIDADFDNGKTVVVGSYKSMFNGKSVFGVQGSGKAPLKLGGIVVDDAHASLGALKEQFTLRIPANDRPSVYKEVLAELRPAFEAIDRENSYHEMMEGIGSDVLEIPYEYWREAAERISLIIRRECPGSEGMSDDFAGDLKFSWPLIKDNLKYCQVVASARGISVAALYPLLDMVPSFKAAKRRVYMSATIADYGDMARAYDLRELKEESIIAPKTVAGVGRRMILAPKPEDMQSAEFRSLVAEEATRGHGVVILAPRPNMVVPGLVSMEVMGHERVTSMVASLRRGDVSMPVTFVNRYNGIDLPDDACRILLLNDLPTGTDDVDSVMSVYLSDGDMAMQRIAQKIEQGVGRGVRGASDHCVVLLVGRVVDWMRRDKNRKHFSPAFQAQLMIGDTVNSEIETAADLCGAIRQDLEPDPGWLKFHASELAAKMPESPERRLSLSFEAACLERRAFGLWREGRHGEACTALETGARDFPDDVQYQGWLMSIAARVAYDVEDWERVREYATKAHSLNSAIKAARPVRCGEVPDWAMDQARLIIEVLDDAGGVVTMRQRFDRDMGCLSFSSDSKEFESALMSLGTYLGFESARADRNGEGPDVYWVDASHSHGMALEAKNEKGDSNPLHKKEAGQLRTAQAWMEERYPECEVTAVSVHPNAVADPSASASNLLALTPDNLEKLKKAASLLLMEVSGVGGRERESLMAEALVRRKLAMSEICDTYLVPFRSAGC